jgi:curli biogenesis system outer membrane secretion channel CsgG
VRRKAENRLSASVGDGCSEREIMRATAIITGVFIAFTLGVAAQQQAPAAAKPAAPAKPGVAKPTPPKPSAAKAVLTVDKVVAMKKAGLGDDLILKQVAKMPKGLDLSPDDMMKLKEAQASDALINALMDPKLATQPAAPPASEPPPVPAPAPMPAETPAATPPPVPAPTAAPVPVVNAAAQKRILALDDFSWATVQKASSEIFKTNVDIGKGIRSLLTNRLQHEGKVRLVERAGLKKLTGEQDFSQSNRVKKGTGARVGNIIGADAYLLGDIVAFGRDDRDKRVKVGAFCPNCGALGGLRIGKKTDKAVVIISYRIVDAETSEVIDSGEARGESKRESKGLGGMLGVSGVAAGGSVDMTSSNFAETIIGEATIQACDGLAAIINSKIPGMPKRFVDLESRIALVKGSVLTISSGSNDSVAAGDRFEVFKILGETRDPVTKEVLDLQTEKVGELVITAARERVAEGNYAGGPVAVGFLARKVKQ